MLPLHQGLLLIGLTLCTGCASSMFNAADRNDAREVRRLGKTYPWLVNVRDRGGFTPLHYAAMEGSPDAVAALLELGADTKAIDSKGESTPLEAVKWMIELCDDQAWIEQQVDIMRKQHLSEEHIARFREIHSPESRAKLEQCKVLLEKPKLTAGFLIGFPVYSCERT